MALLNREAQVKIVKITLSVFRTPVLILNVLKKDSGQKFLIGLKGFLVNMGKLKITNLISVGGLVLVLIGLFLFMSSTLIKRFFNTSLAPIDIFVYLCFIFVPLLVSGYYIFLIRSKSSYVGWVKASAIFNILAAAFLIGILFWGLVGYLDCISNNAGYCDLSMMLFTILSLAVSGFFYLLGLISWIIGIFRKKK